MTTNTWRDIIEHDIPLRWFFLMVVRWS